MKRLTLFLLIFAAGLLGGRYLGLPTAPATPAPHTTAPAAPPAAVRAEGRVAAYPDAAVVVASEASGLLTHYRCREKTRVKKGEVLAQLRADALHAAKAEAEAQVREAEASLRLAGIEAKRAHDLTAANFLSRQASDRADQTLAAAQARHELAQAAAARLRAELDKTVVRAPLDGTVVARTAETGQIVAAGEPLCTLADLNRLRVEAEVDEYDIARLRPGAAVAIQAEGYVGQTWQGRIEEIPDRAGRRSLRPQDPARPEDVHVLTVKISLPRPTPLKLGQRVEVRIAGG